MQTIEIPIRNNKILHGVIYKIDDSSPFVILCHGFTGDQHEWGRFDLTATELNKHGYNALTFDFSGSGKNTREPITLSKQAHDLEDVFSWVQLLGYKNICTLGLSFGGMTALVANLPDRDLAIFWAPAFYFNRQFPLQQRIKLKIASILNKTPVAINSVDTPILIDYDFMSDNLNKQTDYFITQLNIPTLIIHGDKDTTIPSERSEEAYANLSAEKKYVIVKGAGHDFNGEYLNEFINSTIAFLNTYYS